MSRNNFISTLTFHGRNCYHEDTAFFLLEKTVFAFEKGFIAVF